VEDRLAAGRIVAHFADELDAYLDRVAALRRPFKVGLHDRIDETTRAGAGQVDRDHLADRPEAGDGAVFIVCLGRNDSAGAVALDNVSENATIGLWDLATLLRGRLSAGVSPVYIHARLPLHPRSATITITR